MQVVITAVGPDHSGLADPIIHYVTGQGANIAEIQMYDHDEEAVFAMLCRIELGEVSVVTVREALMEIGRLKRLSIRIWSSSGWPEKLKWPGFTLQRGAIVDGSRCILVVRVVTQFPKHAVQAVIDVQLVILAQQNLDNRGKSGCCQCPAGLSHEFAVVSQ